MKGKDQNMTGCCCGLALAEATVLEAEAFPSYSSMLFANTATWC